MPNNRVPLIIAGVFILISIAVLVFFVVLGIGRPQNAVPSKATSVDPNQCQGNPSAPAKCFKCETGTNKNNPVGVLDFACFFKYYDKNVGKP